ncbi:MAG: hypothetical protein AABW41_02180 [Nanoarchaeota archaeon]
MNKSTILFIFTFSFLLNFVAADSSQVLTFNATSSESIVNSSSSNFQSNLKIKEIRQDPFPVNPGDYTDIYIKLENYGAKINVPRFEILLSYPFSLDPSSDRNEDLLSIDTGEKRLLHYKTRVDKTALPGDYDTEYRAYIDSGFYYPYFFQIKVDDVTSDFDIAIQEVSKNGVSLGLANIGKNNAKSITLKIPNQEQIENFGYETFIIGNLNAGDDTSITSLISPKELTVGKQATLKIQLDYTDILGNRRSLFKEMPITITQQLKKGFDDLRNFVYGIDEKKQADGLYKNIIVFLIVVLIATVIFFRRKQKK